MITRNLDTHALRIAAHYPILTITGPRQSGKTTLCRAIFPGKPYVSLEQPDTRDFARRDPRGFLAAHAGGAILDEVQNAPDLLSYLQGEVDERPQRGRFVLTGSQHFGLMAQVSQSLAGRTGVLHLLPPGYDELRRFPSAPAELVGAIWAGSYPAIFDRQIPADRWLADYVATYVQRDVRQILNVADLEAFTTFLRHCAGRTAQEVNLSAIGADAGVSHATARAWLSVLETSFICFRIPAWHRKVRRQLVKAPKLHFFDTGLACYLLGINTPEALRYHPLRGALFETWVASEIHKARTHRALEPRLLHLRDAKGLEVDLVLEAAGRTVLVEAKSGATVGGDFFGPLAKAGEILRAGGIDHPVEPRIAYGGDRSYAERGVAVLPWTEVSAADWGDG